MDELCSYCYTTRYGMMQSTPYSIFDKQYQAELKEMNEACGLSFPLSIPPPLIEFHDPYNESNKFCASDIIHLTGTGDTCDSIAERYNVASAAVFMGNVNLFDCETIPRGIELCIPFACDNIYLLQEGDTCLSIEEALGLPDTRGTSLRQYNPWLTYDCSNLHEASDVAYGRVLCVAPQAGNSTTTPPDEDTTTPEYSDGYVIPEIPPPDVVLVAEGTTMRCGKWHVVTNQKLKETCTTVCVQESIPWGLFLEVNPSLDPEGCELGEGLAYCVGPSYTWDIVFEDEDVEQ